MRKEELFAALLTVGLAALQPFVQGSEFYTAAVVEFAAADASAGNPAVIMRQNALNYEYFLQQAASKGVDIVVFPECGLTGIHLPHARGELRPFLTEIPDPPGSPSGSPPAAAVNPCLADAALNTSQLLRGLSCAVRRAGVYAVVNLPEAAPCRPAQTAAAGSDCPADGFFIFNTNVAFDRRGNLIARYRKYNLFIEPGFNIEPTPAHVMFDTDFGVRFGMFVCFDILFREPSVSMVTKHNLTDMVYSTAWFSEFPFLTAVQTQAAWSHATDTNLLAAGYNNPRNKNTGSGIYAGKDGAVTSFLAFDESNKMLVAQVKKKSRASGAQDGLARTRRDSPAAADRPPSPTNPAHQPLSYNSTKSFINYLLQHVKTKETDKQCEDNKKVEDKAENIAKRDVMATNAKEEIIITQNDDTKDSIKYHNNLHLFNTALLNLTNLYHEGYYNESKYLCHFRLCCNFAFSISRNRTSNDSNMISPQYYRVGVFDGSKTDDYQTCLIMKCSNSDITSCNNDYSTVPQDHETIFEKIMIEGVFKDGKVRLENDHMTNGSFDVIRNNDSIIMHNTMQIHNLTSIGVHVDKFPIEDNESSGKYKRFSYLTEDLSLYNTVLLGEENINKNISVCQGNLCCEYFIGTGDASPPMLDGRLVSSDGYYFRVGAFGGLRTFMGAIKAGLQVCSLFTCTGEAVETCGHLKNHPADRRAARAHNQTKAMLEEIQVRGRFEASALLMPSTLTSRLLSFNGDKFDVHTEKEVDSVGNKILVTMTTKHTDINDVLTFGVFARDFDKDNDWQKAWYNLLLANVGSFPI